MLAFIYVFLYLLAESLISLFSVLAYIVWSLIWCPFQTPYSRLSPDGSLILWRKPRPRMEIVRSATLVLVLIARYVFSISETLDLRHDDGRSRSPWSLCWCWFPLLLLFLLPFLFGKRFNSLFLASDKFYLLTGLWSLAGRSSETAGVMGPSAVIYSFYRGWFGADNRDAGLVYNLNSTVSCVNLHFIIVGWRVVIKCFYGLRRNLCVSGRDLLIRVV